VSLCIGITLLAASGARAGELVQKTLSDFVGGEWRINGAWKDGAPIQGREVFEWGVGKQFIICKTFLATPKGEYQRYETIFGEQDGKLMAWGFTYDGHMDATEFNVDQKKMSSPQAHARRTGRPNIAPVGGGWSSLTSFSGRWRPRKTAR
jgi:hypothetical protein